MASPNPPIENLSNFADFMLGGGTRSIDSRIADIKGKYTHIMDIKAHGNLPYQYLCLSMFEDTQLIGNVKALKDSKDPYTLSNEGFRVID